MRTFGEPLRAEQRATGILDRAETEAVFPPTALRVHHIVTRTGATLRDLEQVVRGDRALAAMILRSAGGGGGYGAQEQISDVLLRLGVPTTRDLAFALSFARKVQGAQGPRRRLWLHALRTGCVAQEIARDLRAVRRSEAFLAGLTHDIGAIAMLEVGPPEYAALIDEVGVSLLGLESLEWDRFGFDHAQLGDLFLRRLGFAPAIGSAILDHHATPNDPLAAIVALADAIDTGLSVGLPPDAAAEEAATHISNGLLRRTPRQLARYATEGARAAREHQQRVGFG